MTHERIAAALQPFLEPGEQVLYSAYGIQQPSWGLIIPLLVVALLPGLIAQAMLTKYFMTALTNRRGLVVICDTKLKAKEIIEYRPGAVPPINVSQGPIFAVMKIEDPRGALRIKFHRSGVANNREQAMAIGGALSGRPAA